MTRAKLFTAARALRMFSLWMAALYAVVVLFVNVPTVAKLVFHSSEVDLAQIGASVQWPLLSMVPAAVFAAIIAYTDSVSLGSRRDALLVGAGHDEPVQTMEIHPMTGSVMAVPGIDVNGVPIGSTGHDASAPHSSSGPF